MTLVEEIEHLQDEVRALLPDDATPPFVDPVSSEIMGEFWKIDRTLEKIRAGAVVKDPEQLVATIRTSVQGLRAKHRPN
jgi:hypothetical protein